MENHIVRMRASPAVGVGGMYATGEGLDEVIRTFSATPPFFERQNWFMEVVDGAEHKVHVVFHDNAKHVSWVWGFSGERPSPEEPLILTTNKEKQVVWYLQPYDNGVPNAYTLLADIGIVGAGWYAGTNEENQVVFKPIPVIPHEVEKPYWVLTESQ